MKMTDADATRGLLPTIKRATKSTSMPLSGLGGGDPFTVTATEAQNEFGRVLEHAIRDEVVVITRHNVARAVLISVERYLDLASTESTMLNTLTDEFDTMFERMQTPVARAATQRGFNATTKAMGDAAVRLTARKRKTG